MINSLLDKIIKKIQSILKIDKILKNQNELKISAGLNLISCKQKPLGLNDCEFKIFSQYGDDGIINYLTSNIKIYNKTFIEFGVENYEESNTRFLLEGFNWNGLVIDSQKKNIDYIKSQDYFWKYVLKVEKNFITIKNINKIIANNKCSGKIGLLSIDIDGNDYWIWKAIKIIDPSIVVIEYNARFGSKESKVIPYEESFDRTKTNMGNIYYGASLTALNKLGKKKGYSLVGTNKNGNNAYFVKRILLPKNNKVIKSEKPYECFHYNTFKESRDKKNDLLFLDNRQEKKILSKGKYIKI